MPTRYDAQGMEAEFEPGSRGRVLRNLQGIRSAREMARSESEALLLATQQLIDNTELDQTFTSADICRMHALWLGAIYPWAGEYRQVNVAKGGFMFAAAGEITRLMREFERGPLRKFTPCRFTEPEEQAQALAVVHAELVLIHRVPRRQRALFTVACHADGAAGRIAGAGFQRRSRRGKAALHCCGTGRAGTELRADDGRFQAHHQADAAPAALTFAAGRAGFSGLGGQE